MVTKEQIERINMLYKKQQSGELTEEEKNEQTYLRKLYVESMKESLRSQLKNIKIVTPEEYEKVKSSDECECEECKNGHHHSHHDGHNHTHDHHHASSSESDDPENKN